MSKSLITNWETRILVTFCVIGLISLTNQTLKLMKYMWSRFFRPPKKLTNYGSWALVTGCTDGIGKAMTFELASKGLNLVLVGRNIHKLQATSGEIWEKYGKDKIQIKSVVLDFEKIVGEEIEGIIREEIEGLDVGVLVNNVGLAVENLLFLHEISYEGFESMVQVNIGGLNWVTRAVIPGMLKKKKGAIVVIGSGSTVAVPSYPLVAVYAATKAYVAMFSRCLSVEYQQHGIDVQCQLPMFVATKMIPDELPSVFTASPKTYAKASGRWIGYDFECFPLWVHALQARLTTAIPDFLVNWFLFNYFFYMSKKIVLKNP